ncbi:MAG: 16S rRNA (uracil(1498)-N(3))-methyltransferase [Planctomycetes bacterium]|nr:16S rRNA (uracil(1498)-N(3))-methyltransferase [Planctomycetota bacterium]
MTEKESRARFYVPDLTEGAEVALPPPEAHHAAHVLRLGPGAAIELFDGRGRAAEARITAVRRGQVTAAVGAMRGPALRAEPRVRLAFAVPKGSRLDWLLEKTTELGVAALRPVRFERSVAGAGDFTDAKRAKWLGHCVAAAKQSGLDWLPDLQDPLPLAEFLADPALGLFGDLAGDAVTVPQAMARLRVSAAPATRRAGGITVLVGPEGGLTDAERETVRAAGLLPVRLGRTTLRIETAAVALVAATVAAWE